jgi:hypothetical protein
MWQKKFLADLNFLTPSQSNTNKFYLLHFEVFGGWFVFSASALGIAFVAK